MKYQVMNLVMLAVVATVTDGLFRSGNRGFIKKGIKQLRGKLGKQLQCISKANFSNCFLGESDATKLQENDFTKKDLSEWISKMSSSLSCPHKLLKKDCKLNFGKLTKLVKTMCKNKAKSGGGSGKNNSWDLKLGELCKINSTAVVKGMGCIVKRDWEIPELCVNETSSEAYDALMEESNVNKTGKEKIKLLAYQVACSDCLNGFDRIRDNCNSKKIACNFKTFLSNKMKTKYNTSCPVNNSTILMCQKFYD